MRNRRNLAIRLGRGQAEVVVVMDWGQLRAGAFGRGDGDVRLWRRPPGGVAGGPPPRELGCRGLRRLPRRVCARPAGKAKAAEVRLAYAAWLALFVGAW